MNTADQLPALMAHSLLGKTDIKDSKHGDKCVITAGMMVMKEIKMHLRPEEPGGRTTNTWGCGFSVCKSVFQRRLGTLPLSPLISLCPGVQSSAGGGECGGKVVLPPCRAGRRVGGVRLGVCHLLTPASSQPRCSRSPGNSVSKGHKHAHHSEEGSLCSGKKV